MRERRAGIQKGAIYLVLSTVFSTKMSAYPNIVLVVMDTARFHEVSTLFRHIDRSSAIHQLTNDGSAYTQAFTTAPWTLPSHASLFTGTYSSKHGAHAGHKRLDGSLTTLAEEFAANDYETVGVSNNTWISEEFGFARGFDTFHKTWQYVQTDTDLGEVARTKDGLEMLSALVARLADGNPIVNVANAVYGQFLRKRDDDGARRTNEWIEKWFDTRNDQPFFLFINYLEPHLDYHPPKELAEQFLPDGVSHTDAMDVPQNAWEYISGTIDLSEKQLEMLHALYFAEIAYLDERIGELKESLIDAGEWDDTIFVLTSDHGENIGEHSLMDHQYCLYDTLLHVPLIITGGAFDGGHEIDDLVQTADLAPTLLDSAGIDASETREQFQGQSFHPDAETDPRERIIAEYMAPQPSMEALRRQVGTLTDTIKQYDRSLRAIRTDEYKLICGSDGSEELYATFDGPDESTSIADEHPKQVSRLREELDEWIESFEHANLSGSISMSNQTKSRLEDLGYIQ